MFSQNKPMLEFEHKKCPTVLITEVELATVNCRTRLKDLIESDFYFSETITFRVKELNPQMIHKFTIFEVPTNLSADSIALIKTSDPFLFYAGDSWRVSLETPNGKIKRNVFANFSKNESFSLVKRIEYKKLRDLPLAVFKDVLKSFYINNPRKYSVQDELGFAKIKTYSFFPEPLINNYYESEISNTLERLKKMEAMKNKTVDNDDFVGSSDSNSETENKQTENPRTEKKTKKFTFGYSGTLRA